MARVKRSLNAKKKRRVVLERAKGYRGQRSRLYRKAKEQVLHSMTYAYRDRKDRKGNFRRLWIQRINAAARANGLTYNRFVQGLKAAGVVDRRVLADLAVTDAAAFAALVEVARQALPSPSTRLPNPPWQHTRRMNVTFRNFALRMSCSSPAALPARAGLIRPRFLRSGPPARVPGR